MGKGINLTFHVRSWPKDDKGPGRPPFFFICAPADRRFAPNVTRELEQNRGDGARGSEKIQPTSGPASAPWGPGTGISQAVVKPPPRPEFPAHGDGTVLTNIYKKRFARRPKRGPRGREKLGCVPQTQGSWRALSFVNLAQDDQRHSRAGLFRQRGGPGRARGNNCRAPSSASP